MSSEMNTFQYDGREKRQSELKFLYNKWLWLERTGNYRIHEEGVERHRGQTSEHARDLARGLQIAAFDSKRL